MMGHNQATRRARRLMEPPTDRKRRAHRGERRQVKLACARVIAAGTTDTHTDPIDLITIRRAA